MSVALGLLLSVVGVTLAVRAVRARRLDRASRAWPVVSGRSAACATRVQSFTDAEGGYTTRYTLDLRYTYAIGGRTYEGTRVRHDGNTASSEAQANGWATRFAAGRAVEVYHGPAAPERSVLVPSSQRGTALNVAVGVGLALLGLAFAAGG